MLSNPFLLIVKGIPFGAGDRIPLQEGSCLLGRCSPGTPENHIYLGDPFISRRHALLTMRDGQAYLTDLGSSHGTSVDSIPLSPGEEKALRDGDTITLASGSVILRFYGQLGMDATMEHTLMWNVGELEGISLNPDKRECRVDGATVSLIGKEFDLLSLLYAERGKVVAYDRLKAAIWPERVTGDDVDVSNGEVNALAYRLRKKLGRMADKLKAVPRAGYMLDSENSKA